MTALLIVLAIVALLPIVHGVWVLAYSHSPQRRIDERLKEYSERD